ncbi:MAG: TolC family protein [Acidobacteriota bacterium]|nr:TolC family protein [Acidobacteriota bacterium]
MLKTIFTFLSLAGLACAEVHTLTLKQAVAIALKQNSDVLLARLDERRVQAGVRIARDPFVPKIYGGSGLAWTSGYPNSIEGSAPSIFQARTNMALFNRPKSYELAEARENVRSAAIDTAAKLDDITYRTATMFLDTAQIGRNVKSLQQEVTSLGHVNESVQLRVTEGRDISLIGKRAELNLAQARQRYEALEADQMYAEQSLALVLGFTDGDRVYPAEEEPLALEMPNGEAECVTVALENNKQIRSLQSQLQAKALQVRAQHATWMPEFDLVAQYALLAKRNYQDFFLRFQRNNGQLGVSIKVPILVGAAPSAQATQAEVDAAKLRTQLNEIRNRTALDTRKSYQDIHRAELGRDVAKLDLDVAREQVSVLLAQLDEGRTTRQAVEEARLTEQEKWIGFYDAQHLLEKAKLTLLKNTGTLQAALR